MPRASLAAASSALWHALTHFGKLYGNRKALPDRTRYRVDGRFVGTVAGYDLDEKIACTVVVSGPQTTASSSGAPQAELVAALLAEIPATRRQTVVDTLRAHYAEHSALPERPERDVQEAKLWLKQLRATHQTEKEGAVSIELDPDPEDLAAAEDRFPPAAA